MFFMQETIHMIWVADFKTALSLFKSYLLSVVCNQNIVFQHPWYIYDVIP